MEVDREKMLFHQSNLYSHPNMFLVKEDICNFDRIEVYVILVIGGIRSIP